MQSPDDKKAHAVRDSEHVLGPTSQDVPLRVGSVLEPLQRGMDSLALATSEDDCCRRFTQALVEVVSASSAVWWREGSPPPRGCTAHQLQGLWEREELTQWAQQGQLLIPVVPEQGSQGVVVLKGAHSYNTGQQSVVRKLRTFLYVQLRALGLVRQLSDATVQIRQSERLQAVGQLAGGVAHDFNNLLMVLSAAAEVIQQGLGEGHPNTAHVRLILETSERAAQLTQKLLSLSRKSRPQLEVLNLHELLMSVRELLQHALNPKIQVSMTIAGGACNIWADSTQLQSALLNICLNARDAMPEGGLLSLRTRRLFYSDDAKGDEPQPLSSSLTGEPEAPPCGEYVALEISDTGFGMNAETMAKIFEPFFTTKEAGQGTGLGLEVVRSTIEDHGGRITVVSSPNCGAAAGTESGTVFTLLLPLATTPADRRGAVSPLTEIRRSLRIFLADDDSNVCRATAHWLRHMGHNVQALQDSGRALRHLLSDWRSYDLLVLDLKMPDPSGAEVHRQLQVQGIDLPTVFVSGSHEPTLVASFRDNSKVVFLQKPYRKAQLELAIDHCMPASEAPTSSARLRLKDA